MTVQVVYKNNVKSVNSGVIALFTDENFRVQNPTTCLSKNETSYIDKTVKNKKNSKDKIISFNINEKTIIILISLEKKLNSFSIENLGASFFNFIKKIHSKIFL